MSLPNGSHLRRPNEHNLISRLDRKHPLVFDVSLNSITRISTNDIPTNEGAGIPIENQNPII